MNTHTRQAKILIVDDDPFFCRMLEDLIQRMGHESRICHRMDDCRRELEQKTWDLILLDVGLPDGSGLTLLPWIRQLNQAPEVIIITGAGDADSAELAVVNGAWDYLIKTTAFERINLIVVRALEHRRVTLALNALKTLDPCGIVGKSPALQRCLALVGQAALNDFNVLITGETGTGKELVARAIHANSSRAAARLVVVDCAALPQTLAESVLFGYVKGAFTGADKDVAGFFASADGSTLFMDEVGDLPLDLQRMFLRVLQEKSFCPVGSSHEKHSDFRLIAATNKDLDQLAGKGKFRKDLLFRLKSMAIHLPPLRERLEDLPHLVIHSLATLSDPGKHLSKEFLTALETYEWPGNIREFQHVMEAAVAAAMNEKNLIVQHLPANLRVMVARKGMESAHQLPTDSAQAPLSTIREYRLQQDRKYLRHLLTETDSDMPKAALKAGLSLSRLYSLLKEHGLK
ncbi:MAG: sigma-54 dependent transcriptional regulator [Proteobacteria bacterium]|nr:sigma-54 dependent transcriptional regulator [Pseudomonadota bacterium]